MIVYWFLYPVCFNVYLRIFQRQERIQRSNNFKTFYCFLSNKTLLGYVLDFLGKWSELMLEINLIL